jgi:ABC-2 type transport system permease protein
MTTLISLESPRMGYGLRHVMRGEWTKVRTLRSTAWVLLLTVAGTLGVTVLSVNSATHHTRSWYRGFDPTNTALTGLALGTLCIGLFGVLVASGEYGSGTIRSSLAAAPRRPLFLLGKVLVVGLICLLVGELLTFSSFEIGQRLLAAGGAPSATLGQAGVLRAVAVSGAFLALLGLLGLGLGMVIRHTAGAIGAYVGVTFLIPLLIQHLPGQPSRFSPVGILANSVSDVARQPGQLPAPLGFLLMALYSVGVLAVGMAVLARRDA